MLREECQGAAPGPDGAEEVVVMAERGFSTRRGDVYRTYTLGNGAAAPPPGGDANCAPSAPGLRNGTKPELVGSWQESESSQRETIDLAADGTGSSSFLAPFGCTWAVSGDGPATTSTPWLLQLACPAGAGDVYTLISVDGGAFVVRVAEDQSVTYERRP